MDASSSSMFRIFDTAASGMLAQSVRLNTTASNMANADSVASSPEQVYRARQYSRRSSRRWPATIRQAVCACSASSRVSRR